LSTLLSPSFTLVFLWQWLCNLWLCNLYLISILRQFLGQTPGEHALVRLHTKAWANMLWFCWPARVRI
jgi:hypothetical protein